MPDMMKTGAEKLKREAIKRAKKRLEDLEAHGIEIEDETQAAVFGVNFGCAAG